MSVSYSSWPFRLIQERSLEETQQWWDTCYVRGSAERILQSQAHWRVLAGGPGSGKSVAMLDLERREAAFSFIVRYPPPRWPKSTQTWARDGNHLAQIMSGSGVAIRNYFSEYPEKIALLSGTQLGFMRWMLEKFGGQRAYHRWLDGLEASIAERFQGVSYEDFYPTTTDPFDVLGQVDELVSLVRRLGYSRILIVVDLNWQQANANLDNLTALFGWQDLMHHPGLALVAAIPTNAVQDAKIIESAQGRVSVTYIKWEADQVREVVNRHIRLATDDPAIGLQAFISNPLLSKLEKLLLAEYGSTAPAGWVALSETILHLASRHNNPLPIPFKAGCFDEIERTFYTRHVPLHLDLESHGVWRGVKFIRLTDQYLKFLSVLKERNGRPVNSDDEQLSYLAGSKGNIHSIASRTRGLIEPFPDNPIYLRNKRGEGGYWLENVR